MRWLVLLLLAVPSYAEETCKKPGTSPGNGWAKGQSVSVNISTDFSADQITAIKNAFANWEMGVGLQTGIGFGFTVSDTETVSGTLNGPLGALQINRGPCQPGRTAELYGYSGGGYRRNGWMFVDPRVESLIALQHTMAHEIGHTLGLDDCDGCPLGSSAMNGTDGTYNDETSGRNGPSPCDNAAVNGYYNQRIGWDLPPGSGADGANCRACTVQVPCQTKEGKKTCDAKGYCCPKGFIPEEDWASTPTCGYINFWGPEQLDQCQDTCNDTCRKKSNCGDAPCMPLGYCWKCPEVDMGDVGDPGPPGRTCQEMGWYPADKLTECEAVNGSCDKRQWCDYGMCQPWPNYCWKP